MKKKELAIKFREELLKTHISNPHSPEYILERIKESINRDEGAMTLTDDEKIQLAVYDLSQSLSNQKLPTDAVMYKYKSYLVQIIKDMEKEYNCTRSGEKITVHTIANAYIRILAISEKMNVILSQDGTEKLMNEYMAILSKELDRANKQYAESMRLLMHMKMRPLNISIKAHNAVFGQNQEIKLSDKDNLLDKNR